MCDKFRVSLEVTREGEAGQSLLPSGSGSKGARNRKRVRGGQVPDTGTGESEETGEAKK